MGAWGTGLFSDDAACDVRDEYKDMVADGYDGSRATDQLVEEWASVLANSQEAGVFWLALAETQWRLGRLEARVREAALQYIDSGADLERWDSSADRKKREHVLGKLRELLHTPPPAARRLRPRFRDTCAWQVGEIVAYTLTSGEKALFRVLDFHEDLGGKAPIVEVLDWVGREVPAERQMRGLPVLRGSSHGMPIDCFILGRTSARELPQERIASTNVIAPVARAPAKGIPVAPGPRLRVVVVLWRNLDKELREAFGLPRQ